MEIKIKRIYEPATAEDGYRVLIDKLWPRGLRKEEARLDCWARDLAPTDEQRKAYHQNPEANWEAFAQSYSSTLAHSEALTQAVEAWKKQGCTTITLLYASRLPRNHALLLKAAIEQRL